jgi:hypothetical protein
MNHTLSDIADSISPSIELKGVKIEEVDEQSKHAQPSDAKCQTRQRIRSYHLRQVWRKHDGSSHAIER